MPGQNLNISTKLWFFFFCGTWFGKSFFCAPMFLFVFPPWNILLSLLECFCWNVFSIWNVEKNCIICCHYCHLSVINDVPSSFLRSQMGGSSQRPSFSSILSPQIFLLFPLGALCCTWDLLLMHIVWREVVMEALNNIWYLWAATHTVCWCFQWYDSFIHCLTLS